MKRALNILLFLGICPGFAQEKKADPADRGEEVYSVYFTEKSLTVLKQSATVSSSYYKTYQPEETEKNQLRNAAGEYLHVDATGIYFEKNKLLFITREQVREEGKYEVRNGYLFGVSEADSIPTALEGENYYFLVPSKTYLYNMKTGPSTLFEGLNAGEYLVVTPEPDGYYSVIYIRFSGSRAEIKELVFSDTTCSTDVIEEQEIIDGSFDTYILTPTLQEWKTLFACFVTYDTYVFRN
ncbi:MAG: hypothetical protein HYZ14_05645 [Bacteroidetes bacterium]|nr:hypothetical protein [Bacteroidota bacterium]